MHWRQDMPLRGRDGGRLETRGASEADLEDLPVKDVRSGSTGTGDGPLSPADTVVAAIRAVLERPAPAVALPERLGDTPDLAALLRDLDSIRSFVVGLAAGDLSQSLPVKGFLGGALKTLQANLKHLTWQTTMIAKGDFSQRVDFMGEFADSFNAMVQQLEQARQALTGSEERYRQLATTDPLTGLCNRRSFLETALREFCQAERASQAIALIMLDLDRFKVTNDRYGHTAGDAVLKEVATRLAASLRKGDTPCRFGGEEFVIALPETDIGHAARIAERIRHAIEQAPVLFEEHAIAVTASLGVSQFQGTGSDRDIAAVEIERAITRADSALYQAKNAGRNAVAIVP